MKLLKQASMWSLSVAVISLAACGGKDGSTAVTSTATLIAAVTELGQADFIHGQANQGNPAVASATSMDTPLGGVALNPVAAGPDLYVADTVNNRVLVYTTLPAPNTSGNNAAATGFIGQGASATTNDPATTLNGLAFPSKVTIGDGGQLVVTDTGNNRVLIWNTLPADGTVAPNVVIGQASFTTKDAPNPPTASSLNGPRSAMIRDGQLIVADTNNNRVLIWKPVPTTNGAAATQVLGQATATTNTLVVTPTQSSLRAPSDVWTDGFNLLIADSGTSRVLYWFPFPQTDNAAASHVIGQPSFIAANTAGSTSQSLFKGPKGIYSDGTRVFVADTGNNRVLIFNQFPGQDGIPADAVLGQEDYSHSTANDDNGASTGPQDSSPEAAPTQRTLSGPAGVAYSEVNKVLYVTDSNNHRVMGFAE